jgi:hypothetical protein
VNASVVCPYCRNVMSLPAAKIGTDVACAKCRCLFVAYSAGPAAESPIVSPPDSAADDALAVTEPAEVLDDREDDEDEEDDRRYYRPPPPRRSIWQTLLMIRLIIYGVILLVVVVGLFGLVAVGVAIVAFSQPKGTGSAGAWRTLSSEEGRFTVQMPGAWEVKTVHGQEKGNDWHVFSTDLDRSDKYFVVRYMASSLVAADRERFLEGWRNEQAGAKDSRIMAAKPVRSKDGEEGLELTIETPNSTLRCRAFLANGRIYLVSVGTNRDGFLGPDADRFLDSFEIIK